MKSLATVLSSALLLAVSCTTVPVTGRKSLNLVGEGTVNQLGAQTYQQEVSKAKVSTDQNATAMVQRVAQRIAQAAEANFHPKYQWQATLLDDPKTVNAWCMPGGKMAVYSGILPLTQDETGLAVVLGHETAHALARHGAERLSRDQLMQVGEAGGPPGGGGPQARGDPGRGRGAGDRRAARRRVALLAGTGERGRSHRARPHGEGRLRPRQGDRLLAADGGVRAREAAAGVPLRSSFGQGPDRRAAEGDAGGESGLRRAPVMASPGNGRATAAFPEHGAFSPLPSRPVRLRLAA